MTITVNVKVSDADARQIGQQVAQRVALAMGHRPAPPKPSPVPWQHHHLFREPVFAPVLVLVDVDDEDEGD